MVSRERRYLESGGHGLLPGPSLPVDASRLVGDISRAFNPLHEDRALEVHVDEHREGFVRLSVDLPVGMTRAFVALLESLAGLVRFVDHRAKIVDAAARSRIIDPEEIEGRRRRYAEYRDEVCDLFDRFSASGMDRKEAVKRTAAALRAQNHPWSTFHLVEGELRAAGRLRKRSRKGEGETPQAHAGATPPRPAGKK